MSAYLVPSKEGTPFATPEWTEFITFLRKEGAGTKPTVWSDSPRWEMSNVHIIFLELFERTYLFADYAVENGDLVNYLGFAEVVFFNIYKHHSLEETFYYPEMTKAAGVDLWSVNAEEHHTFDQNLEAAMIYLRLCRDKLQPTPSPSPVPKPSDELMAFYEKYPELDAEKGFDPKVFRQHLDKIILLFGKHMIQEIETLKQDNVKRVGEKEYKVIESQLQAKLKSYSPEWFLISAVAASPPVILKQLLPLPYVVTWVLIPLVWGPKFSAWWRYCPYPENLTLFGKA